MNEKIKNNDETEYSVSIKEYEIKKTKFNKYNKKTQVSEKFNPEKILIKRNGKFINAKDYAEANREGTEIYETLKKYNGDVELTKQELNSKCAEISELLTGITDLRTAMNKSFELNRKWENLPSQIREKFGNSKENFLENGEKWINKLINEKIEKIKKEEKEE